MSVKAAEDNPFQLLIQETNNDPAQLQARYESHRVNRNKQQSTTILSENFPGWSLDEILKRLDGPEKEDGFVDPRNCLVIWAKPPPHIRDMVAFVQNELKDVAPSLWFMPSENLHTTVLEVAHSLTKEQIGNLVHILESSEKMSPAQIVEYPLTHQAPLLKPMISFDSAAMALSFVPAAGEASNEQGNAGSHSDQYTYHHLRGDVFDMVRQAGIPVASRYIYPSAHLTIARFINHDGFSVKGTEGNEVDRSRVKLLIDRITEINQKLENEFWPRVDGSIPDGGEWIVGRDRGFVIQRGRLWYGGGDSETLAYA
ncbi:RNA ligase/cyclic nucleotide phosphodiesterase [Penicillium malachiteum]|uniref:RNA ligase/cyclic nucleotide phosphodiesterase n=1 Tax=Penicillium malachiteum TaxID=1324776 RepID=UPI002548CB57|nr:RNA ligase/cyclic nucleotide phosphodiesterase [Penicillium malachiteum]KAJ5730087.1 RNA ligase/cyclic nucleotide phosphodiesterase [Penicillium malachiteum]